MTPISFIYGPMKSGKTARLIGDFYALSEHYKVTVVRPSIDTRSPDGYVKSRNGSELQCKVFASTDQLLSIMSESGTEVLLVDEAQFLPAETVKQLIRLSLNTALQVRFYGLMTDYLGNIFEASETITKFSQKLEPLFANCHCGKPAQFTQFTGESNGRTIIVGHDEEYFPVCTHCFLEAC